MPMKGAEGEKMQLTSYCSKHIPASPCLVFIHLNPLFIPHVLARAMCCSPSIFESRTQTARTRRRRRDFSHFSYISDHHSSSPSINKRSRSAWYAQKQVCSCLCQILHSWCPPCPRENRGQCDEVYSKDISDEEVALCSTRLSLLELEEGSETWRPVAKEVTSRGQ